MEYSGFMEERQVAGHYDGTRQLGPELLGLNSRVAFMNIQISFACW
jgi:hypothetical protein